MNFNKHSNLEGLHALLGASQYHWIFYDEEKLISYVKNIDAKARGTELHEFAATCIRLKQKLPRTKDTLNMYVNDAIGFRMTPEQVLYYSENCFGTADTICYHDGILRIHDYKSGTVPAKIEQLMIYSALFFLEYGIDPAKTETHLRIYQNNDILPCDPNPDEIKTFMDTIVRSDEIVKKVKFNERG